MDVQYESTCWREISPEDRMRIYRYLTLKTGNGSGMKSLIRSGDHWHDSPMTLARLDGRIIGWAIYTPTKSIWAFVMARYRRKGIGREMVHLLSPRLTENYVTVHNHDRLSRSFWKSVGCKDSHNYYGTLKLEDLR